MTVLHARTATFHLHTSTSPWLPNLHLTGNLIGRINLTKVSKPSGQCILTLLFSTYPRCHTPILPPPPPEVSPQQNLSEGPEFLPHLALALSIGIYNGGKQSLQCFWYNVEWTAKSTGFGGRKYGLYTSCVNLNKLFNLCARLPGLQNGSINMYLSICRTCP